MYMHVRDRETKEKNGAKRVCTFANEDLSYIIRKKKEKKKTGNSVSFLFLYIQNKKAIGFII